MPCGAQGVCVQGPDAGDQRERRQPNEWNRLLHNTRESDLPGHAGEPEALAFVLLKLFSLSVILEYNLLCCLFLCGLYWDWLGHCEMESLLESQGLLLPLI